MIASESRPETGWSGASAGVVPDDHWWDRVKPLAESLLERQSAADPDGLAIRELAFGGVDCQAYAVPVRTGPGDLPVLLVTVIPEELKPLPRVEELSARHGLTEREAQVARLVAERRSTREIARELFVTDHTVRRHLERVLRKLNVHSRKDVERVVRSDPAGRSTASGHGR